MKKKFADQVSKKKRFADQLTYNILIVKSLFDEQTINFYFE